MKLQRTSAPSAPHYRWAGRVALVALLAGCSSDVEAPIDPAAMPSELSPDVSNVPGSNSSNVPGANTTPGGVNPDMPPGSGTMGPTPNGTMPAPSSTDGPALPPVEDPPPPLPACGTPATSQIPRLTNAQYENTVYDLLKTVPSGLLATEQQGEISKSVMDGYHLSADSIAAQVMADPALKANFMKCEPVDDGAACLSETIQEFGQRAYRRPLTADETAAYEELVAKRSEITETGSVDEVAELLLRTFLKSPNFLSRAELAEVSDGAVFKLSSYEVASRLSYMLWDSMPDDDLFAAAAADQLQTREQIVSHARRMISDDKARSVVSKFHREYLHLTSTGRWGATQKDATLFPSFSTAVVPDMILETEMLLDKVFTSGGGFQDLLTTNVAFVTANTAPLYGLNPADFTEEPQEVQLEDRPGFLTRVGFLAAFSNQNRTNPIVRGAFITKDVLGIDPGPPDPDVTQQPLPNTPGLDTIREKVDAMTAGDPCVTCHGPFINPPGFVLEAYDATGALQTVERDTGAPIDTQAEVVFTREGGAELVSTPAEMMAKIAESIEAQKFYASKWVGYAYKRELTEPDACTAEALSARVAAGGYSIQDLLTDLTQTDSFVTRAIEVTP